MRGPLRLILGAPPIARDPLYRAAGQMPAFDLRFDRGSIVDVIGGITPTFTRPSSVQTVWTGAGFTDFAADVPAFAVDPTTGRMGYVHNPAATNLFLNSASPATQSFTVTAQAYTLSFYGTGTITLSGASTAGPLVGTGAAPSRVQLTFTPSAGTLTLTLSGSIVRPQLQTGTVADSPITTAGSAVARAADTMTVSGVDFSRWYNQLGGTVYVEAENQAPFAGSNLFLYAAQFDDTTNNNLIGFDFSSLAGGRRNNLVVRVGGINQAEAQVGSLPGYTKWAGRVAANNVQSSSNGQLSSVDSSAALPTVTQLAIGRGLGQTLAGTIYRLAYFPPGPAQSRLQQMTL
jgi:hypothetical protein